MLDGSLVETPQARTALNAKAVLVSKGMSKVAKVGIIVQVINLVFIASQLLSQVFYIYSFAIRQIQKG